MVIYGTWPTCVVSWARINELQPLADGTGPGLNSGYILEEMIGSALKLKCPLLWWKTARGLASFVSSAIHGLLENRPEIANGDSPSSFCVAVPPIFIIELKWERSWMTIGKGPTFSSGDLDVGRMMTWCGPVFHGQKIRTSCIFLSSHQQNVESCPFSGNSCQDFDSWFTTRSS